MFELKVSAEHLAIISRALGAAPYDMVRPVIVELQRQIDEQKKQQAEAE